MIFFRFDLRIGAGSQWDSQNNDNRINIDGARLALEQRCNDIEWGGHLWLQSVLNRARIENHGILPNISGILTGFIDLTFRVNFFVKLNLKIIF